MIQIPSTHVNGQAWQYMPISPVLRIGTGGESLGLPRQLIQPISDLQVQ